MLLALASNVNTKYKGGLCIQQGAAALLFSWHVVDYGLNES